MSEEKKSRLSRFSKSQRRWGIAIVSLLIVLVAATTWVAFYAEPMLKERVEEEADQFLGSDIDILIGDLSIGYFPLSVTLSDIEIIPLQRTGEDAENLRSNIERVRVTGIPVGALLGSDDISLRSLVISGADLHIVPDKMAGLFGDTNEDSDEDLKISSITIENTNINIYRGGESEAHTTVDSLNLQLSSLDLSAETHQLNQLIGSAEISARKIVHRLSDGHYRVEAENPHFDLNPGNFTVNSFAVIPEYSPHELPRRLGHETDHFDIRTDNIQLRGFRAAEWLDSNELIADVLNVNNLILEISRDKNFPDKPRTVDPLLNVQFANFPFAVSLDTLNWEGGMILYREMEEGQDEFGEIRFEEVDIEFAGIQNRNPEQTIQASARSEFLGISTLTADFEFFLANNGRQNIRGNLEQIDLKELNPVLEPLAFVRIDDGQLSSLEFEFTADDEKATGEFVAIYQDLSIKILDEETLEESTSDNIMSFVTNLVAIRSSNDGDEPRIGEIDFDREEDRSMFNYWWKSLRDGITSTVQRF